MKIAEIVGARPQFIKSLPVQLAFKQNLPEAKHLLIHTGQHYDYLMSKIFFEELELTPPDYHLDVGSGNHGMQTGRMLEKAEEVLIYEKPDIVIVYGDTNSTLAGALAASKLHIPVAHIEAGLRSYNKNMPEEINRVLTDHLSSILFCPTRNAIKNLIKEGFSNIINDGDLIPLELSGINSCSISNPLLINVGDVMYDSFTIILGRGLRNSIVLKKLGLSPKNYISLTLHRAENTDNPERLRKLISFTADAADGRKVIFPAHPRTLNIIRKSNISLPDNLSVIEPLGYFDMLSLVMDSLLVFTDSGGLQKEAYWMGVPCVTLRDETEWLETLESGWNILYKDYCGTHSPMPDSRYLYGDGKAGERIAKIIKNLFE